MHLKKLVVIVLICSQLSIKCAGGETNQQKKTNSKSILIASLTSLVLFQFILHERSRRKLEGLYATQYKRARSIDKSTVMLRAFNAINELGDVLDRIKTGDLELADDDDVRQHVATAKSMLKTPRTTTPAGTPRRNSNPI